MCADYSFVSVFVEGIVDLRVSLFRCSLMCLCVHLRVYVLRVYVCLCIMCVFVGLCGCFFVRLVNCAFIRVLSCLCMHLCVCVFVHVRSSVCT